MLKIERECEKERKKGTLISFPTYFTKSIIEIIYLFMYFIC